MSAIDPPLKWHGGKHYLARRIVDLMPPHIHYVEPFFGGGSVLLARDPEGEPSLWVSPHQGVSEVVNDLNGRLVNFWRVLQGEATFQQFRRIVEAIPLARAEWESAHDHTYRGDPVEDAVAFFVDCRQSLAGRMRGFTAPTRTRTRRRMNGNVSEWLTAVDGLPAVHARLRRVFIENLPALDLIRREDGPGTLFYCDPPYLHETRTSPEAYGHHEMTEADHVKLLSVLRDCKGKVMLSGYPSNLYDTELKGWARHDFELPNNAAGGDAKRRMTECLWCNF
jgi:DNA adenine methylase